MGAERSDTSSDSTRSLTTCEGKNMHGSRPEAWYESDRLRDKPDRLPDSTDVSNKSLDAKYTSDKSPDTVDDTLPDSTKGSVMGLSNLKDSDRSSHLINGDRSTSFEKPDSLSDDTSDRSSHFDKPNRSSDDNSDRSSHLNDSMPDSSNGNKA
jgi:hypothetical protein